VYENPAVTRGLNLKGIEWAFTHSVVANWHPLTMLSHMLDCQLYGLNAGGHHLTNILLHTATVILLFLVLRRMTGFLWRSAFVAAVFAIHPLRVESVAWVAERKDVLSGLFFMLTSGRMCAMWTVESRGSRVESTSSSSPRPLGAATGAKPKDSTLDSRLWSGAVVFCVGSDVQADAGDAAVGAAAAGLLAAGKGGPTSSCSGAASQ
jgi:hypothetical protein